MIDAAPITDSGSLLRAFTERARGIGLSVEVLGDGNFAGQIAVVAAYPGENEVKLRTPLVGGSGRFLWDTLRPLNINRTQLYVTNVIKRQVAFGRGERIAVGKNEFDHWAGLLEWELSQLPNLKYVLILGGEALEALVGQSGIDAWRGSVVTIDKARGPNDTLRPITYIITHNPANIMRRPELEMIFKLDMAKLDMVLKGTYAPHPIKAHINPSPAEAIAWLDRMQDERKPTAFDIETAAMETVCVGFANDPHEGMCISFRDLTRNRFSVREEVAVRRRIAQFVGDSNTQLVAQNGNFDSCWLWYKDRIRVRRVWFDTLLAHHTLISTLPHNLGFLTAQYTTHPYYKDEKDTWRENGDINAFWEYNVKDCCITLAVQRAEQNELVQQGMADFFFNHVMRLQPHLTRMTVHGVRVDTSLKQRLRVQMTDEVKRLLDVFHKRVRIATHDPEYKPNPLSTKDMTDLLFNRLRLVGKGTKTDETNRTHMMQHPRTSDAAKDVLISTNNFKEQHKLLSTYAETPIDPDNRFRAEFKQYGTQKAPGRLSSAKAFWGTGGNMQNIPETMRAQFVADEGYCFIYFDQAQAEARYVGWDANITTWKHQFEKARLEGGYDAHRALCADMFKMPYDETPKEDWDADGKPTKRYISKRCRHGLNYRMNFPRLAEVTELNIVQAKDAYDRYHQATPELRKWWDALIAEAKSKRVLFNAFGRRLVIPGRLDDDSQLESIVAFKPQSSIGDKVCKVIYEAQEDDRWVKNALIWVNVHDSVTAFVPSSRALSMLRVLKEYAEKPIYVRGEQLIIPADCKISVPSSWDESANKGKGAWVKDPAGLHRWNFMEKVKV